MWINRSNYIDRAVLDNVTMYASSEITISGHEYTKHYFMGSERIASNFGSGFANAVTPVSGTQTLISNSEANASTLSEPMVQKLRRDWECVGLTSEYVEWNTDINVFDDLDDLENENTVYFFLTDHLGSTSWILTGSTPIQHLQYLPFGEDYISEQNVNSTFNTNFTFIGKERDVATGYSYFGFRYYDPNTSIWLGVDPLSDRAPGWTPYRYGFNNPLKYVDPNGLLETEGCFPPPDLDPNIEAYCDADGCFNRSAGDPGWKWTDNNGVERYSSSEGHVIQEAHISINLPSWASDFNLVLGAFGAANGTKTELLEFAVRNNYKSAKSWSEFNKLRPTQQTWRTANTLGKNGAQYLKYTKGLGYIGAGLSTTYSIANAGAYYYNGGKDWEVGAKATLDVIMTGVGFLGPIGFGISVTYFILDNSTDNFGGFGQITQ